MSQKKIVIVGSGWRVENYLRILAHLKKDFLVQAVVTRNPEKKRLYHELGVVCVSDISEALTTGSPDFILLCINMNVQAEKLLELLSLELPLLVETPLGINGSQLEMISRHPKSRQYTQIAEQYAMRPLQKAQLQLIRKGVIGVPQSAQVSLTNNYHAFSLLKAYLQNPGKLLSVQGNRFTVDSRSGFLRDQDTDGKNLVTEARTIGIATFEKGAVGIYDFEGDQHRSYTRFSHLSIRGDKGEINNEEIRYVSEPGIPSYDKLWRIQRGINENMEGSGLKGIQFQGEWLYKNPFSDLPFSDDDIATAEVMLAMAQFCETGESFYSIDEAIEDMTFTLLLEASIKSGQVEKIKNSPQSDS
ncbi:Gfo/Idh/MocA family oxidoreductase [Candidatus Enterococcus leclercqii]|uniref:Gfo/Idh/MocA family oxidoreductase n=1 Tax=Enterococcus TaxID=1350 RepID=UPI00137ADD41|nr:Gfo/Idh/MocA family oxidoreductase [Enterococcus sp. CU9D]KAF1291313.1 hypothetical protein BAU14_00270 [Enterococcus sp. CU9D]